MVKQLLILVFAYSCNFKSLALKNVYASIGSFSVRWKSGEKSSHSHYTIIHANFRVSTRQNFSIIAKNELEFNLRYICENVSNANHPKPLI